MRILIIHQYYLFSGQPGGSRFNELAKLWTEAGHDVTVIAGTVNYNTGEAPAHLRRRWITRERDGQVTVLRCHVPETYTKSYAGRMWAFFGFTLSASSAALTCDRPDVVIATSPPLTAAIPGYVASRLRGTPIPWVFEIRDLWPESAITTGVLSANSTLTRLLYKLERWACQVADRVNVLTPAFRKDLVSRGLTTYDKIIFIPNGADAEVFTPGPADKALRTELGWGDRFVVMYAGAHGRANDLQQLIDAASALRDHPEILIACVGDGPQRASLEADARKRQLDNIIFNGPIPKERMPDVVRACDVGAAVLADNPTFRTVYPNKVFDYMACERPTLLAIDGVIRELVCNHARAGVFAQPGDGEAIAEAIRGLANDRQVGVEMGQRGRAWVLEHATRRSLAARYLNCLQILVEEGLS